MIAAAVILICLSPLLFGFLSNGGNTDIPRSPRVGPDSRPVHGGK